MDILARVISFVFHPLLMATYLLALMTFYLPAAFYPITPATQWSFLLLIFLMTFALPAINISLLRIFGTISSFTMMERRERIRPFFLITIIYCFVTYIFLWKTRISPADNLFKLLIIIDCLVIAATVITFFYKISVHSLGIMGILGIIIPLNKLAEHNALFVPTIIIIIIAGFVMSSRLQLNSHTSREVWFGALTGFSIGFLGMIIFF